ncbi:MAG TPA: enoyl-CoA hydratase/isomerase family protein [Rhizomicrobium sp.]|nr:enoyl-CoA hydratase/isomerase family protein [Rhizomicrobium sp.]
MLDDPHVIGEKRGRLGLLTLNRPETLNALTRRMVQAIAAQLEVWAQDDGIAAVAIRGQGARAFCAGADIRALQVSSAAADGEAALFLAGEYRLNAVIAAYPKPYIALLHGIVMGGGVGLSVHGRYRVADASLDFAMPETGIGFVVDVGASYFLPRCPGEVGLYLALTGARIGLSDACEAGLITHASDAANFEALIERLAAGEDAERVIAALAQKPGPSPLLAHRRRIDALFSAASPEAILERLERDGGDFARDTLRALRARSPTAIKYTFRQIREGRSCNLPDCLKIEYRIALRALSSHDFREGVRAALIDKDRAPKWRPASLAEVFDAAVADYFAPLGDRELDL